MDDKKYVFEEGESNEAMPVANEDVVYAQESDLDKAVRILLGEKA